MHNFPTTLRPPPSTHFTTHSRRGRMRIPHKCHSKPFCLPSPAKPPAPLPFRNTLLNPRKSLLPSRSHHHYHQHALQPIPHRLPECKPLHAHPHPLPLNPTG